MRKHINNNKGFNFIELMVALAIFGVLITTLVPLFITSLRKSQSVQCSLTRRQVEESVGLFYNDYPLVPMPTLAELVRGGYLNGWPYCSAGGEYVWIVKDVLDPKLGCSIHFWEEEPKEEPPEEESPPKEEKQSKKEKSKEKEKEKSQQEEKASKKSKK
jgi:prepilin-type N-terminal cleavage/methylation domain-containing protein